MAHRKDKTRSEEPGTDQEAHRHPSKTADYKGEAQNVNDDNGRPLTGEEAADASNKATVGKDKKSLQ